MSDPLRSKPKSLPEHMSPAGDRVFATLIIRIQESGALSVEGPIENREWCIAVLENAKDAIRNHHLRKDTIIVPGTDVDPRVRIG